MNYLKLRKNGIFELYSEDKLERILPKDALPTFLTAPIRLEDGITLEEVLLAYPQIYDFIPWDFTEHLEEMKRPYVKKTGSEQIDYLEVSQIVTIDDGKGYARDRAEAKKMGTLSPLWEGADLDSLTDADMASIEVYASFGGVGTPQEADNIQEGWKKGDRIPWGLSFSPVNELKGLPVRIAHQTEATVRMDEKWLTIPGGKDYNPSLLDFYYAIVYELTWYGPPSKRDAQITELRDRLDEVKGTDDEG